uniref:Uncharacterized protein n=1 Tax=Avena sativa TaxID=4498 RepID=A0ACD5YDE7_AVESA
MEDASVKNYLVEAASEGNSPVKLASYNIERVTSIFSSFVGEKARLVRWIGFGGLLRIGARKSLNDDFSLWLLSILDTDKMALRTGRAMVLSISDLDISIVMGIPHVGIEVDVESKVQPDVLESVRLKLSLDSPQDRITIPYLEKILTRDYGLVMSYKEEEAFKIATVLYAMTTLLGVQGLIPSIRCFLLNYLVDTSNIHKVNWARYVLSVIKESALSVQQGLASGCTTFVISGCTLALQTFYIDNMDFGSHHLIHDNVPRVSAYAEDELDKLIAADLDLTNTGIFKTYGITRARHDVDVMYNRQKSKGVEIHVKFNEKMHQVMMNYVKEPADYYNKCIKESENFKHYNVEPSKKVVTKDYYWAIEGRNTELLDNVKMPLVQPQQEGTSSRRSAEPIFAQCNTRKRFKTCAVKCRKKSRVGYSAKTIIPAKLSGEHSFKLIDMDAFKSLSGIVKESEIKPSIHPWNSTTLFGRLKTRCNRLGSGSHNAECIKAEDALSPLAMVPPEEHNKDEYAREAATNPGHSESFDTCFHTAAPGCQFKGTHDTPNHLAMVVYDPVAAAERCPAILRSVDPSMAPKKVFEEPDYTASPFDLGYHQILPNWKKSRGLYKLVQTGTTLEADRVWFRHRSPWLIEISGRDLIAQFKRGAPFSEELTDGLSRGLTELDDAMFGPSRKRFRHYLPASFTSTVLSGRDYLQSKHIRDAFVGDHLKYDVEHCRHIIAPVPTSTGYSCYIWDISARDLLVLDPMMMNVDEVRATQRHKENMDALCNALVKCTQTFFDGWSLEDGDGLQGVETSNYSGRCRWNNSGLYTMHYARWYRGMDLDKSISDVELGDVRADMFYQLLNMASNVGDLPSIIWRLK